MDEATARQLADNPCAELHDYRAALGLLAHVLDDERRAPREAVPPRTLAAIEAHIARVEGERDDHKAYAATASIHDRLNHEHRRLATDALRYGHAECERLRAALREACDEAALWGHVALVQVGLDADADMLELHDALVATLARLRAVADGGAR